MKKNQRTKEDIEGNISLPKYNSEKKKEEKYTNQSKQTIINNQVKKEKKEVFTSGRQRYLCQQRK